jgi:hypothetical protein
VRSTGRPTQLSTPRRSENFYDGRALTRRRHSPKGKLTKLRTIFADAPHGLRQLRPPQTIDRPKPFNAPSRISNTPTTSRCVDRRRSRAGERSKTNSNPMAISREFMAHSGDRTNLCDIVQLHRYEVRRLKLWQWSMGKRKFNTRFFELRRLAIVTALSPGDTETWV